MAKTKNISDLEDFIVAFAPDAPAVVLQHVLREGTIRFMRQTRVAVDEVYFGTQPATPDYLLDPPECRKVIQIERVWIGPRDCSPGLRDSRWYEVSPAYDGTYGYSTDQTDLDMTTIILQGVPNHCSVPVCVQYSWTIARDGCDIPDALYEEYVDGIKYAALYELLMMPNQEWTDKAAAVFYGDRFREEVQRAKNRKWSHRMRQPLRMSGRSFL